MAKLYGKNPAVDFAGANLMSFGKSFSRLNGQPLDKSEVWYNYQDLVDYAKTDAAYVGQKVFYVEMNEDGVTGTVNHYSIEVDGSLKSLGQQEINITVTDDDVVNLEATGTSITASHAKKGPEGGATKGATADAEVNAFGGSIEFKVPNVTVDEYGHTTALDEKTIKVSIPNAPADNDTKTSVESGDDYIVVDGSLTENASNVFTVKINETTLKALIGSETTAAMEFKGATASLPENAQKGDIYKVSATFIVDAENNAESDEADPSGFITEIGDSIVAEGNGKWYLIPSGDDIEDTWRPVTNVDNDSTLTFSAGSKLAVEVKADGSITYSHEAVAAPVETTDESGARKYLTSVTTDDYGHIVGFTTAIESVVDTNDNDTYSAGNGISISEADENDNHIVSVKLGENENHLKFAEDGSLVFDPAGIDTDTNTTYDISANGVSVTLTPSEGDATTVTLDAYTKSETDTKIDEKIASVTGGESAADVKLALESYRDAINVELWGESAKDWTSTTTDEDGKVITTYNPQYGSSSRLDAVETKLLTIESGAQVNKIESVDTNNFIITEAKQLTLANGKHLITDAQVAKLDGIAEGAEKNFISSVDEAKFTVTEGKLLLKENYVTAAVYSAEVGDLTKLIRDEGRENTTLVDEINYINERLTWGEMA